MDKMDFEYFFNPNTKTSNSKLQAQTVIKNKHFDGPKPKSLAASLLLWIDNKLVEIPSRMRFVEHGGDMPVVYSVCYWLP
jgi:hypothetical protein